MKIWFILWAILKKVIFFDIQPQDVDIYNINEVYFKNFEKIKNWGNDDITETIDLSEGWIVILKTLGDDTTPLSIIYLNINDISQITQENSILHQIPSYKFNFLQLSTPSNGGTTFHPPNEENKEQCKESQHCLTSLNLQNSYKLRVILVINQENIDFTKSFNINSVIINELFDTIKFCADNFDDLFKKLSKSLDLKKYSYKVRTWTAFNQFDIMFSGIETTSFLKYIVNQQQIMPEKYAISFVIVNSTLYKLLLQNTEITNEIIRPMINSLFECIQVKRILKSGEQNVKENEIEDEGD